jgi:hypothetical protein
MPRQIYNALHNSNSLSDLTDAQRERARALGISDVALRVRLHRGWPPERATGELSRYRMPDGQRQRYRAPPRGKWTSIAYHCARERANEAEVAGVCREEGLPVPIYRKPSRRSPMPKRRANKRAAMFAGIDNEEHHRDP